MGIGVGQQVRVKRSADDYALYTVTDEQFEACLDSQVVHPTIGVDEAAAIGEFIERLHDDGRQSGLIAIAPHGGDIEVHTDQQAQRVATRLADMAATYWCCKGYHPRGAERAWHITSVDIHPASFPLLHSVFTRQFEFAVAFHGFARDGILVGGAGPKALKAKIKSAIQTAVAGSGIPVRIAKPSDEFGGDDPCNIVNRLTTGETKGIQIEQGLAARTEHWRQIADAVASVFGALDFRP